MMWPNNVVAIGVVVWIKWGMHLQLVAQLMSRWFYRPFQFVSNILGVAYYECAYTSLVECRIAFHIKGTSKCRHPKARHHCSNIVENWLNIVRVEVEGSRRSSEEIKYTFVTLDEKNIVMNRREKIRWSLIEGGWRRTRTKLRTLSCLRERRISW
jgi:hypothetical protein